MNRTMLSLILAIAAAVPACNRASVPVSGTVEMLSGTVAITDNGVSTQARVGDALPKDAMITTGETSFVKVSIGGNIIEVYEKSTVIFGALVNSATGAEETRLMVGEGTIFSRVKKLMSERGSSFMVQSCTMVASVRGTEFLYSVDCYRGLVATYKGVVGVRSAGDTEEVMVPAGQLLTVEAGKKGSVAPIPQNFRYRDFTYKKSLSPADEASGTGSDGGGGVRDTGETVSTAEKRGLAPSEKRSAEPAVTKKKEAGSDTVETIAAKQKDEGSSPIKKKTDSGGAKGGAMTTAARAVKPGGLLDKPRMNLPELK